MNRDADCNRIRWRCRRGMLELDIALQTFVARYYPALNSVERAAFERFLHQSDSRIMAWLQGCGDEPENDFKQFIEKIR